MARKPLTEASIADNVLKHGTGGINVDGCRIGLPDGDYLAEGIEGDNGTLDPETSEMSWGFRRVDRPSGLGRWPANVVHDGNLGEATRYFYSAKADADDRFGSRHPTVKPINLMRWLVKLVTPPGGKVVDPFAGSGTTGVACLAEGFDCILIEREERYVKDINERLTYYVGDGRHSLTSKGRNIDDARAGGGDLPLFQEMKRT